MSTDGKFFQYTPQLDPPVYSKSDAEGIIESVGQSVPDVIDPSRGLPRYNLLKGSKNDGSPIAESGPQVKEFSSALQDRLNHAWLKRSIEIASLNEPSDRERIIAFENIEKKAQRLIDAIGLDAETGEIPFSVAYGLRDYFEELMSTDPGKFSSAEDCMWEYVFGIELVRRAASRSVSYNIENKLKTGRKDLRAEEVFVNELFRVWEHLFNGSVKISENRSGGIYGPLVRFIDVCYKCVPNVEMPARSRIKVWARAYRATKPQGMK